MDVPIDLSEYKKSLRKTHQLFNSSSVEALEKALADVFAERKSHQLL